MQKYCTLTRDDITHLLGEKKREEIDELWNIFYDSQYIPARRNQKHAYKMLPEKYSQYSEDTRTERLKIENRAENTTLQEFFK